MTSMQLPVQLEPWRIWLTLLAPDLVESVGALLLRLDPLVGKLSSSARDAQDARAGVGDIVLRGNYERMLMSEWLIADAEPDEFLRRAANNELLFTGPEPTVHKRSRLCIALFDVGPAQLGEPRLAHLAMFILLSRRAEEAGAQFLWGVLQMPGKLTAEVGAAGLRGLFGARTLNAASEADLTQWGEALATAGADASDNWLVAGTRACALAPKVISSRIGITRDLLQPRLRVELTQRRSRREAVLPLPDPAQAVRLLRDPFQPLAPLGRIRHMEGRPSLKQAPRFSLTGGSLAVPQLDGGIAVYQVPQSPRVKPGKARLHKPFAGGNVLGTCVHKKAVGLLAAKDSEMVFSGLEGTNFGGAGDRAPRPDNGVLQAPVGLGRWLPLFHHMISEGRRRVARVCLLDQRQTLVAWSFVDVRNSPPSFDMIAEDVLGVAQFGNMLTYAKLENNHTRIYRWNMVSMQTQKVGSVPLIGRSVIFGGGSGWFGGGTGHGVLAVQVNDTEWWLGNDKSTQIITLPDGGTVIGVYSPTRPGNPAHVEGSQNLLVLQAGRKKIYRVGKEGRTNVVDCPAGIAQVAWSANAGHLAWITNEREMFVRRLDMEQPLLHVIAGGEEHER